jgi:hypothetical protein
MNSPIRTSAIGFLQHLQLLYLPSELDIYEQIQPVTLPFYCMQYHPVTPTDLVILILSSKSQTEDTVLFKNINLSNQKATKVF